ncbi:hypothetical protein [Aquimarina mytili]|uniref:Uncharacterized protein n=1 Tax=Aquimarina mytili TaxID=874423 RepID=A0A936ZV29_9FLAO|nr:hypothetical protein [Aquimarina mytili]MBL0682716.1 hypothetical protein [Aquimarina mytili]
MEKQLNRFLNTKRVIHFDSLIELTIDNEESLSADRSVDNVSGVYDIFNDSLYAILSFDNKNYLFLKDQFLEITKNITIKPNVNWSKEELSSFEVFEGTNLLTKVEYVNVHEGILMPFDMIENWEEVNFGFELASLVNKVKENPELILFPDSGSKAI